MGNGVVVYSAEAVSEKAGNVSARLREHGVEILEEQPQMLLVSGPRRAIDHALSDSRGWNLTPLTKAPPPRTQYQIRKPPSCFAPS
jgi:hypothetical protein